MQPALDGTSQLYAELDAETTAIALQAFATTPTDTDDDSDTPTGDSDEGDGDDGGAGSRTPAGQGRRNLEAFKALCQLRHRNRQWRC